MAAKSTGAGQKKNQLSSVLEVKDLRVQFHTVKGIVKAVNGVDFRIRERKVLGVVGESGCGKSVTALSVMNILSPTAKIVSGNIFYYKNGIKTDIAQLKPMSEQMLTIRANEISMIFQEPMSAFCPVYNVGYQIGEVIGRQKRRAKGELRSAIIDMLSKVGISAPEKRVDAYPFELSGGMCQRSMIAMALIGNPSLLIADEPTTALDVTVQAQILALMRQLQKEYGMAIMFITHDLGVISDMADDVVVMYMGQIMETGEVHTIFHNAKHPYTLGLLSAMPSLGHKGRLNHIKGSVPNPYERPEGCPFINRCASTMDRCNKEPPQTEIEPGHSVKCWLFQ